MIAFCIQHSASNLQFSNLAFSNFAFTLRSQSWFSIIGVSNIGFISPSIRGSVSCTSDQRKENGEREIRWW